VFFVIGVSLIVSYVALRVGWLYLRRAIGAACKKREGTFPPWLAGWAARQAVWSFDAAWKKLWMLEDRPPTEPGSKPPE
jgi:hypothetical protein